MRKGFFAAGLLLAVSALNASAQEGFHAGLTTGYYYTTILDKGLFDSPSHDHETTFRAAPIGLALGYQWNSGNGIQVEINSAGISQKMDINSIDPTKIGQDDNYIVTGSKEINLSYIQVPILFKKSFGDDKVRFNIQLGPQISFLTKGEDIETYNVNSVIFSGTGNNPETKGIGVKHVVGSTDEDIAGAYRFNKTAVGAIFGMGVDVHFTEAVYLSANLRLGYNFTEIRDEDGGEKFVDKGYTAGNTPVNLYQAELRSAAFGGVQLGIHYLFGQ